MGWLQIINARVAAITSIEMTRYCGESVGHVFPRTKQNPYLHSQIGVSEFNLDDDLLSHGETPHYH
ncbi:hypothetical protein, partial [Pseudomonas sp. NPDC086251]|uniref:hypothetical protein n=1 Tax=Pseudomonas sp. NPDC086251 TaxID=3364431 RepID=UPI0038346E75